MSCSASNCLACTSSATATCAAEFSWAKAALLMSALSKPVSYGWRGRAISSRSAKRIFASSSMMPTTPPTSPSTSKRFGSTIGVVYTVFDLLNREELLSAKLDGGPESLQILLGLAKEGIFGTRASLAFSVFNNVIHPRFARSAQGPFFSSHSEGINVPWTYPLTNTDSLAVNYSLSRTTTEYLPASLSTAS